MAKITLKGQLLKQEDEIKLKALEEQIKLNIKILNNAVKLIQNWEKTKWGVPGGLFDTIVTIYQRADILRGYFNDYSKLKNKKYK
jgi:hypothetical protein